MNHDLKNKYIASMPLCWRISKSNSSARPFHSLLTSLQGRHTWFLSSMNSVEYSAVT